ncbi:MAG TPA: MFS transporter, partial [Mycobacteriales bacterium]
MTGGTVSTAGMRGFLRVRVGGLPRPFWVLWSGTLVNRLGTMVQPFLAFYLSGARGMSVTATGSVLAVIGIGGTVSQLIGGFLTDRIGRRATLTVGMLATGAVMLGLGYARDLWLIVVTALLLGLTVDLFRPAAQSIVADLVPVADRPRAFGILLWAINLGFSVAMVLGGVLARDGYQLLFWIDALTGMLFGLLVWRAVPETRARVADHQSGRFADVLGDRVMVCFAILVLACALVFLQAFSTLPLAMRAAGLSPSAYGLVVATNGIVIIAVQPLVGHRLGRWDPSRTLAGGMLGIGVGYGLTSLVSSTAGYAATVVVWTLGEIVVHTVAAVIVATLAPAHLRGRYNGLYGTAWGVAALAAPLLGTTMLQLGTVPLWSGCLGLCAAAAIGQLALGPAIRHRAAAIAASGGPNVRAVAVPGEDGPA